MDSDTYLVLRLTGREEDRFDSLRPFERNSDVRLGTPGAVDYRVDAQALDDREYRDLRRDREVAGIARPIPVQLIAPVLRAAGRCRTRARGRCHLGVHVTGALQSPYTARASLWRCWTPGSTPITKPSAVSIPCRRTSPARAMATATATAPTWPAPSSARPCGALRYAVAPGVRRALIGKVLGTRTSATTKEIIDAIQWAVDGGAHVINLSLGFDFPGLVRRWTEERKMPADLATSRALAEYRDNVRFFDCLAGPAASPRRPFFRRLAHRCGRQREPPPTGGGLCHRGRPARGGRRRRGRGRGRERGTTAHGAWRRVLLQHPRGAGRAGSRDPLGQIGRGYTSPDGTSMASPHATGVATLWAERQLQRNGMVNSSTLDAQLRGNARREHLPGASYLDVGEGSVSAPLD